MCAESGVKLYSVYSNACIQYHTKRLCNRYDNQTEVCYHDTQAYIQTLEYIIAGPCFLAYHNVLMHSLLQLVKLVFEASVNETTKFVAVVSRCSNGSNGSREADRSSSKANNNRHGNRRTNNLGTWDIHRHILSNTVSNIEMPSTYVQSLVQETCARVK